LDCKVCWHHPDPESNPLTQELIDWADVIIVMDPIHSRYIHAHFQCDPGKIQILNIADRFFRDDPELISILQKKVPQILAARQDFDTA
jgi:predicted protein tyrosine phosphatase